MKITVSNMVCNRCVMVVENILNNLGYKDYLVEIGKIKLVNPIEASDLERLRHELQNVGFDIVEDRSEKIIQSIKDRIISYIIELEKGNKNKLSSYITQAIFYDYSYLSDLFSKNENQSIEQYFIELRIDKAKEKLKYSTKTLSEIAYELGYSSPQHFANQFKQHTGISPNTFRKQHAV